MIEIVPVRSARRRLRSRVMITVIMGVVTIGSVGGLAYWRAPSAGQAVATAGTLKPVTLEPVTIDAARLRPLGGPVPVEISVKNSNDTPARIRSVVVGAVSSDTPGCGGSFAPTGVTLNVDALVGQFVPANSTLKFVAAASMDASSDSQCQGARFRATLRLTVSV